MSNKFRNILVLFPILFLVTTRQGNCQNQSKNHKLYFISDCQQPLMLEKIRLKPYRNEEARDTLFSDIIRQEPQNLFLLGDLTSKGSNQKSWNPLDELLHHLKLGKTSIHAIPGNHEYYTNAKKGIQNYAKRFPGDPLYGYCVKVDSMAIVMLNSNFNKLDPGEFQKQQSWYKATMTSLDTESGIKMILVCVHHSPYTNSKIVKPSLSVILNFLPRFKSSPKAKLLISGHSHNLEFFTDNFKKNYLVIGGGGGLSQPLHLPGKRLYGDLIPQDTKPVYFYLIAERKGNSLVLSARGLQRDFNGLANYEIGTIQ